MTAYRESSNAAKAVRRGIVEPRPVGGKKRQDKPVIVESRWPGSPIKVWREWRKSASYADLATAEAAMANQQRKHPRFEYRIKP